MGSILANFEKALGGKTVAVGERQASVRFRDACCSDRSGLVADASSTDWKPSRSVSVDVFDVLVEPWGVPLRRMIGSKPFRMVLENERGGCVDLCKERMRYGKYSAVRCHCGMTTRIGKLLGKRGCSNVRVKSRRPSRKPAQKTLCCCAPDVKTSRFPVSVSLDANVNGDSTRLYDHSALKRGLKGLRCLGVSSVSVSVWWGLVESIRPNTYDWAAYRTLFRLLREFGFQIKVLLCFHGKEDIQLPEWVLEEGMNNPDIFFTDRMDCRYRKCLSLGVDAVPVLRGRTALTVYDDFMRAFRSEFGHLLGSTISSVTIGLGPDGELKYPAHPSDGRWSFPGVGEFQCYDRFMLSTLTACAGTAGQWDWVNEGGPHDAGGYNDCPSNSGFFSTHGRWRTPYGRFFLQWYASMLMKHAHGILQSASSIFGPSGVEIGAKVPMTHWWYNDMSHPAELTTGIYNVANRDGYLPVISLLQHLGVSMHLDGIDLRNTDQPDQALCNPEALLMQIRAGAGALGVPLHMGNARVMDSVASWDRMRHVLSVQTSYRSIELPQVASFTMNLLCEELAGPEWWACFQDFLQQCNGGQNDQNMIEGCSGRFEDYCDIPFCIC